MRGIVTIFLYEVSMRKVTFLLALAMIMGGCGDESSSVAGSEEAKCGNGTVESGEACDDGNASGGNGGCKPDCTKDIHCGDGILQAEYGESCEPSLSTGCNANCEREIL